VSSVNESKTTTSSGIRLEKPVQVEIPTAVELSVVMPCLNEAETLETCIRKAQGAMREHKIAGEVVIADNGSTDGSQDIALRNGARLVNVPVKGYGAALMGGIVAARGKYVMMADADDSYDFTRPHVFLEKLHEGYDLVMGNRFKGGIEPGAMPPLHRYLGNPVLTFIGRLLFRSPCGDFHCGLRAFDRQKILGLDLRTTGMEFASEMIVKSTLHGLRIAEVPTTLQPDGRSRPPHLRSWRDGWRHLRFLMLYSPRWLFLIPGILMMLAGLGAMLWLMPGRREVAGVSFDIHSLVYAAMVVVVGYQAVTFALFTKIFAISEGLLPEDARLNRWFRYVTLETGLIAGALLAAVGVGLTIYALVYWNRLDFGPVEPGKLMRLVIPAITCLTLGVQTMFCSFFLSVLGLRRK
jgi:glycosyltransferase involved in cell wall biosynthesis